MNAFNNETILSYYPQILRKIRLSVSTWYPNEQEMFLFYFGNGYFWMRKYEILEDELIPT